MRTDGPQTRRLDRPNKSTSSARTRPAPAVVTRRNVRPCERVFGECEDVRINNTKSYIGHAMGAAGALELAGNLASFDDRVVHPTINVDELDPECELPGLVLNEPQQAKRVDYVLNNSFGMLGINSVVIIGRTF